MKFNEISSQVDSIGDIEGNKVSIDINNLDFIITILSTNLYSKPIHSFLRETMSNAWDSHVEAGVDNPVVLKLGYNELNNEYFCSIQDFGVGLSPERFNSIYKNIGSSTKRDSNQLIGGFGIGRFSALAYSDSVNITSVYNHIQYHYLMYKNGNSISIDLLSETSAEQDNGVEVRIPVKEYDLSSFVSSVIDQLAYFENMYFHCDEKVLSKIRYTSYYDLVKNYFETKTKDYKNFKVTNWSNKAELTLLLGKVVYPLRWDNIKYEKTFDNLANYPIAVKFDIGDLDITPNREEIQYTSRTIEKILCKLEDCEYELEDIVNSQAVKDFTNLTEYVAAINDSHKTKLCEDVHIYTPLKYLNFTYLGVKYNTTLFKTVFNYINTFRMFRPTHFINYEGRISTSRNSCLELQLDFNFSDLKSKFQVIRNCTFYGLKPISKKYLRHQQGEDIEYLISLRSFRDYYKRIYKNFIKEKHNIHRERLRVKGEVLDIFRLVMKKQFNNLKAISDFSDKDVPQDFIEANKKERKERVKLQEGQIALATYRDSQRDTGIVREIKHTTAKNLERCGKLIIYTLDKEDENFKKLYRMFSRKCIFCDLTSSKLKKLSHLHNLVNMKDLLEKTDLKLIKNVGTAMYIHLNFPFLDDLSKINNLEKVSKPLQSLVEKLTKFKNRKLDQILFNSSSEISLLANELYELCKTNNTFNEEIFSLVKENETLLHNSKCIIPFSKGFGSHYNSTKTLEPDSLNILIDYILARKLFRPNFEAVKNSKKSLNFIKKETFKKQ